MSTDNVIYVQRRAPGNQNGDRWYVWNSSLGDSRPEPNDLHVSSESRSGALIMAHDMAAAIGIPSHGVQELPSPGPVQIQAQKDAEWIRELVAARVLYHNEAARIHLREIANRLESREE